MNRRGILAGLFAVGCPKAPCGTVVRGPQIEGPYYLGLGTVRQDITEGRTGLPVQVDLTVVDAHCTPLEGVQVDLWHADADGVYSGYAEEGTEGEAWLRGRQTTDSRGEVRFSTILPGLYVGRTAHYHLRLQAQGFSTFITQVYFSRDIHQRIREEYDVRDGTRNDEDSYYRADHRLEVREGRKGFTATGIIELS